MATGVLFDVDGVLIDSAAMYSATWSAWAGRHGIDVAVLLAGIEGERGIDAIARVAPHLDTATELEILAELVLLHESAAQAYPGAAELLTRYRGRCGLVTSGPRAGTLRRFSRLELPLPEVVICGEDVPRGKPDPIPFQLGCARLGVDPADCVVVEDAPAGIAAGRAAGCHVLAVTTSVAAGECSGAHEILADLSEVARRLAELIPDGGAGDSAGSPSVAGSGEGDANARKRT